VEVKRQAIFLYIRRRVVVSMHESDCGVVKKKREEREAEQRTKRVGDEERGEEND